jgi:hypothetical protein
MTQQVRSAGGARLVHRLGRLATEVQRSVLDTLAELFAP